MQGKALAPVYFCLRVLVGVSTRPILDATSPIRYFAWFRQMAKSGPSGQAGEAGETGEVGENKLDKLDKLGKLDA